MDCGLPEQIGAQGVVVVEIPGAVGESEDRLTQALFLRVGEEGCRSSGGTRLKSLIKPRRSSRARSGSRPPSVETLPPLQEASIFRRSRPKKGACVWCRLAWTGLHYCLFLNPSSIAACLGTHANRLPESEKFGLRRSVFLAHDRVMSRGVRGYFPAGNISADFITSYVHVLTPLSGLVGMRRLRTPVGTRRLF
jgi:hypothetical protein